MPQRTSQEIQAEVEAKLAELPEEERAAIIAADEAADRAMCLKLSRETGHQIEMIAGDRHHIRVDGQVMGYVEFGNWMQANMPHNEPEESEEDDEEGGEA